MANTQLTQTGAEVQADLDKVEGLANIKTIGSGLSLSAGGELSASGGGGTQLYKHEIYWDSGELVTATIFVYSTSSQNFVTNGFSGVVSFDRYLYMPTHSGGDIEYLILNITKVSSNIRVYYLKAVDQTSGAITKGYLNFSASECTDTITAI